MRNKTLLIVDDDQGFAHSLSDMVAVHGYRSFVSPDLIGALGLARRQRFDCAIIDYNLGATLGTTLIEKLKEERHTFPVIVITAYGNVRLATQAMKLGATDFIEKPFEPDELLMVIANAISSRESSAVFSDAVGEARQKLKQLTPREAEIVDAVVSGKSNKQIAELLDVSQRTVEAHRANVLQKLGLANTASLVRIAVLAGLGT